MSKGTPTALDNGQRSPRRLLAALEEKWKERQALEERRKVLDEGDRQRRARTRA